MGMEGKDRSHPCGTHRAPSASWSILLSARSSPSPCAPGACGSSAGGSWCWLSWSGCHCCCQGRRSPPGRSASALWKRAHREECGCGQSCSSFHGEEAGGIVVPPLPWLNPRFSHSGRWFWNATSRTSHNTQQETQKQRGKQRLLHTPSTRHTHGAQGNSRPRPCWGTALWFSPHSLTSPLRCKNRFIISDFKRRWKKENIPLWRWFLQISFWIPSQLDLKSKLRSVVLVLDKQIPISSQQARRDQPPVRE